MVTGAGLAVYQTAYYVAVQRSGVAFATLVTLGAGPILIAVGARLTIGERLGPRRPGRRRCWPRSACCSSSGARHRGASGCRAGVLARLGGRVRGRDRAAPGAGRGGPGPHHPAPGSPVAGVLLAPLAVAGGAAGRPGGPPLVTVGALGYLGAVSTALAYSLFFASLGAVRATTVSVVTLAEPLTASVIAVAAARRTPHLGPGRRRGRAARRGRPAGAGPRASGDCGASLGAGRRPERSASQGTRDHQALDLVGALDDLQHLGLPHVPLDRVVG